MKEYKFGDITKTLLRCPGGFVSFFFAQFLKKFPGFQKITAWVMGLLPISSFGGCRIVLRKALNYLEDDDDKKK